MEKRMRKSNGQGYTYRVGNSWKTVIEVAGRKVTATNKSKQESRRLAKEKASKITPHKGVAFGANRLTLNSFLIPWLEQHHKSRIAYTTYNRYRGIAKNYILPALGTMNLQNIGKRDIALFLNSLAQNGIGARTSNQALALLSVSLSGAVDAGLIELNPTIGISKTPEVKRPIKPLSREEVVALLDWSSGDYMHARLHIAFAGLRQGEALGLRWRNIDLTKGSMSIEEQVQKVDGVSTWVKLKSNMSVRTVFLSSTTIEALRKHKAIIAEMRLKAGISWKDNDLVFPNRYGGVLQSKVDYARWKRALEECALTTRRLHDARHTAGTLLFANGEGIETIRRVLGHSSVNLTSKTYVHTAEAPLISAAKTMDRVLKGNDVA